MNQEILKQIVQEFNNLEHLEGLYLADYKSDIYSGKTTITKFICEEKTPIEFIKEFLLKNNNACVTCKPDNTILTYTSRHRSLNEVYDVTKTYFPNYTVEQYFQDLLELSVILHDKRPISIAFCGTIKRYVIHVDRGLGALRFYKCLFAIEEYNKLYFWGSIDKKESWPFLELLSKL